MVPLKEKLTIRKIRWQMFLCDGKAFLINSHQSQLVSSTWQDSTLQIFVWGYTHGCCKLDWAKWCPEEFHLNFKRWRIYKVNSSEKFYTFIVLHLCFTSHGLWLKACFFCHIFRFSNWQYEIKVVRIRANFFLMMCQFLISW